MFLQSQFLKGFLYYLIGQLPFYKNNLILRPANMDDFEFLFCLANEPSVRANSFSSNPILLAEHAQWFQQRLNSQHSYMFIAEKDSESIGQIRIEADNGVGVISFSIVPSQRSRGYGTALLQEITQFWRQNLPDIHTLVGYVRKDNVASCRAFLRAGFQEKEEADRNMYWIKRK